jgi:3-oxoacyl-[acyl-carrier protein] reductase
MNKTRPLAVVFGGSRGIGAACVESLVRDGFNVAFTYVSQGDAARRLEAALGENGARVLGYSVDVVRAEAVDQLFIEAVRDFGAPVRAVVANAGINVPPASVANFGESDFRRLVDVNLIGAFHILRAAGREVADDGAIVALTTSMVRHAAPGIGPYSATKAAVECLVRSMAKELASRRVRVNAVAPGPVDTDLFRSGKTDEAKQRSASLSPLNRIGTPAEIAEVVSFLLSSRSSWIDGQIIQPNGAMV